MLFLDSGQPSSLALQQQLQAAGYTLLIVPIGAADSLLTHDHASAHLYLRVLLKKHTVQVAVATSLGANTALPTLAEHQVAVVAYLDEATHYSHYRVRAFFVHAWRVWVSDPAVERLYQQILQRTGTAQLRYTTAAAMDTAWWQEQISEATAASTQRLADTLALVQQRSIDISYFAFNDRYARLRTPIQHASHYLNLQHSQDGMRKARPGAGNTSLTCSHRLKRKEQKRERLIDTKTALHLHAFYPDMLPDLLQRLQANTARPDLFISVASEQAKSEALGCFQHYEAKVEVRVVPNKGRDIGPFLTEFGVELVDNYAVIGHIHTKKSLHNTQRDAVSHWQHFLWQNTIGSAKHPMMDTVLQAFAAQPELGMVYPDDPMVLGWDNNYPFAELIGQALGQTELPHHINFPAGTMFWARAEVLRPLVALGFDWDDYAVEPVGKDGTMLHALERLFGLLPQWAGFTTAVTYTAGVSR